LRRLTARTAHYASRLALEPAQLAAVRDAQRVLAAASQEVERIWLQSDPAPASRLEAAPAPRPALSSGAGTPGVGSPGSPGGQE
jgi:hypothetical protein